MIHRKSLPVIKQFFRKDLLIFFRDFPSKIFDATFLLFTNAIVFTYFMPVMGISSSYGSFIVVGLIALNGFFGTIEKVSELLVDISGNKTILSTMSFPITSSMALIYIGIRWALTSCILTAFLFPLGKLFIFNEWDWTEIAIFQTIILFITIQLFFSFFSLWLTSILKKVESLGSLWLRFINPLFMFGAYFYSWKSLYNAFPSLALISLFNPILYAVEGLRGTCLNSNDYLPFWLCFLVLWGCILFFGWHAVKLLKKRLDCV